MKEFKTYLAKLIYYVNSTCLANILHLNNQVSIQDVHWLSWYFRNDSRL